MDNVCIIVSSSLVFCLLRPACLLAVSGLLYPLASTSSLSLSSEFVSGVTEQGNTLSQALLSRVSSSTSLISNYNSNFETNSLGHQNLLTRSICGQLVVLNLNVRSILYTFCCSFRRKRHSISRIVESIRRIYIL